MAFLLAADPIAQWSDGEREHRTKQMDLYSRAKLQAGKEPLDFAAYSMAHSARPFADSSAVQSTMCPGLFWRTKEYRLRSKKGVPPAIGRLLETFKKPNWRPALKSGEKINFFNTLAHKYDGKEAAYMSMRTLTVAIPAEPGRAHTSHPRHRISTVPVLPKVSQPPQDKDKDEQKEKGTQEVLAEAFNKDDQQQHKAPASDTQKTVSVPLGTDKTATRVRPSTTIGPGATQLRTSFIRTARGDLIDTLAHSSRPSEIAFMANVWVRR
ncbi:unnamed protein product [Vitrella brassicaformis CCMP3155]|uniref:Uncharacterized protein n=1 Tax=Vitrella brassicaformis (strain CCMP3155) TaxID=1169540 RepID=A0A0G4GQJ0_VITBC|nr:unnamed protein product [Vitrella brassicaformis CCMP3155]|mmetsp:Transcript_26818/g.66748  ORF Transcript_26818/g.66748 Transcript_26818/m.66748 type:complete len:267 (-) Transcript_26818:1478-2278(-)|eukprot:CEM32716.1 unnamed protein product [Vitrella brassicaformis CCMP3155]